MGAEAALFDPAVLLVPFPAQGHVTPMLHLARALAAHGVLATVAVPDFIHRRIAAAQGCCVLPSVALASIPSGIAEEDGGGGGDAPGFGAIAHTMENYMPAQLERMLVRRRPQVACVVVDVLASWAVPVAERCGVPVAGFWPAMLACYRVVAAIPELMEKGLVSESGAPISSNEDDKEEDLVIRSLGILPAQVELRSKELPWLVGDKVTQASRFAFWLQTLHRARSFRWVLVNSFPGEGCSADDAHKQQQQQQPERKGLRVLPVRPALLPVPGNSNSLSAERTKTQQQQQVCGGKSSSPSMWPADASCIGWLDAQRAGSVVYVSFGSWVGPIGPDKVRELALGLEASGRPFLWALKRDAAWRSGLPAGFAENEGRGKVVDWAPQEDVLRHGAVGCYLTHCGWNSTVEAIQHGVRLLCCPVAGDQFINCAYITGLWGIGLKLGGAVSRDDVKRCIERIMDGEEGARLKENVTALREKVVTAEARCTAERNVKSFVDEVKREHPQWMQMYSASL